MKKLFVSGLFVCVMGVSSGCAEHDTAYYQSNIAEAKEKSEECHKELMSAVEAEDKDRLIALQEDKECRAADRVYRQHKRELARLEEEKKRAETKRKFEEEYKKQLAYYQKIDVYALFEQKADCRSFVLSQSAKCKAYKEVYNAKLSNEVETMTVEKPEILTSLITKSCSGLNFNNIKCIVARDAMNAKRKKAVEHYLSNRNALKVTFNECVDRFRALRDARKFEDARLHLNTFTCSTVGEAARKLRVYSFNKPIS
jgi:hypothetical protein